MILLDVYLTFPDNSHIKCGELVADDPDPQNKIKGAFEYSGEYLEHPKAFDLDPVSLLRRATEIPTGRSQGIHAVFEDALPDDWGRGMLIRKANLPRSKQNLPNLLEVLGANALGALVFVPHGKVIERNPVADFIELPDLLDAAMKYDAGLPVGDRKLNLLFAHGSSPGGARPKAVIKTGDGIIWIAKFPREKDTVCVELIEAGSLHMAALAGLNTPDFKLQSIGKQKILMVKRFDISDAGGRYHMISMQTLLKAGNFYQFGYNDIFEILRKYSSQPSIDIPLFFRQMVFNAALGNTDDHLKNFCMLHKESGFCLSPVYDVLPDIAGSREHVLSFPITYSYLPPDRKTFIRIGDKLNIPRPDQIITDVYWAVQNWKEIFNDYQVPVSDIRKLEWGIENRLKSLKEDVDRV